MTIYLGTESLATLETLTGEARFEKSIAAATLLPGLCILPSIKAYPIDIPTAGTKEGASRRILSRQDRSLDSRRLDRQHPPVLR